MQLLKFLLREKQLGRGRVQKESQVVQTQRGSQDQLSQTENPAEFLQGFDRVGQVTLQVLLEECLASEKETEGMVDLSLEEEPWPCERKKGRFCLATEVLRLPILGKEGALAPVTFLIMSSMDAPNRQLPSNGFFS